MHTNGPHSALHDEPPEAFAIHGITDEQRRGMVVPPKMIDQPQGRRSGRGPQRFVRSSHAAPDRRVDQ